MNFLADDETETFGRQQIKNNVNRLNNVNIRNKACKIKQSCV